MIQEVVKELTQIGFSNSSAITSILFQRGYKEEQQSFYKVRAKVIKEQQRLNS